MKTLTMLLVLFSMFGCAIEEDCYTTDEVDYQILREKPWGTYYETVYKMECK